VEELLLFAGALLLLVELLEEPLPFAFVFLLLEELEVLELLVGAELDVPFTEELFALELLVPGIALLERVFAPLLDDIL
jgi:hypothetical protein